MEKKEKEIIKESEFGLGLVYNLFLFAKHWSFISELETQNFKFSNFQIFKFSNSQIFK